MAKLTTAQAVQNLMDRNRVVEPITWQNQNNEYKGGDTYIEAKCPNGHLDKNK